MGGGGAGCGKMAGRNVGMRRRGGTGLAVRF